MRAMGGRADQLGTDERAAVHVHEPALPDPSLMRYQAALRLDMASLKARLPSRPRHQRSERADLSSAITARRFGSLRAPNINRKVAVPG